MQIHKVGTRSLLIDLDDLNQVMAWHAGLTAQPLRHQVDCIAAATTILLSFDSPDGATDAARDLEDYRPSKSAHRDPRTVDIDVQYNGEDLDEVADFLDMFSLLSASVSLGSYFFRERRSTKVLDKPNTKDCD